MKLPTPTINIIGTIAIKTTIWGMLNTRGMEMVMACLLRFYRFLAEVCEVIPRRIEAREESCINLNGLFSRADTASQFSLMNTLPNDDKLAVRATKDAGAMGRPAAEIGRGKFFEFVHGSILTAETGSAKIDNGPVHEFSVGDRKAQDKHPGFLRRPTEVIHFVLPPVAQHKVLRLVAEEAVRFKHVTEKHRLVLAAGTARRTADPDEPADVVAGDANAPEAPGILVAVAVDGFAAPCLTGAFFGAGLKRALDASDLDQRLAFAPTVLSIGVIPPSFSIALTAHGPVIIALFPLVTTLSYTGFPNNSPIGSLSHLLAEAAALVFGEVRIAVCDVAATVANLLGTAGVAVFGSLVLVAGFIAIGFYSLCEAKAKQDGADGEEDNLRDIACHRCPQLS
jgi:hypothetical protein